MLVLAFQYDACGVYLPALRLWLDAHKARKGADRVFVSHAHSDHIAAHREVILTAPTARFLGARLPGRRLEHVLAFHEPADFETDGLSWRITLLPAGHILGSAMCLIEAAGESLLYTGDFNNRPSLAAEPCVLRPADVLIMETTFGKPEYRFPSPGSVFEEIVRFCRDSLAAGTTPVLLAYSLGKSQELLAGLADAGLPILLHDTAHQLAQIYEQFGRKFPPYAVLGGSSLAGHVVIAPPMSRQLESLRGPGAIRTAVVTGWAMDSTCRYRSGTDAAFPLSDHADFPGLIDCVRQVGPKQVFTLHGFAGEFAWTLRDMGFDARALGRSEQMTLALGNV